LAGAGKRLGNESWVLLAWALISLPAFLISPALDDWFTAAPYHQFDWAMLRPHLFWRPLEVLNRTLAAKFLFFYPGYLHLSAVVGHGACALLLLRILRSNRLPSQLQDTASLRTAGVLLFVVAPGLVAPVWSVDGAIQIWSTMFGLAATHGLVTSRQRRRRPVAWLAWLALAALSKESGLGWSIAAPLIAWAMRSGNAGESTKDSSTRSLVWELCVAALFVSLYFLVRYLLVDAEAPVLAGGRYQLQFSPWLLLRNAAMVFGVAISTVDTVFLLSKTGNAWLGLATGSLSLPLLFMLCRGVLRKGANLRVLGAWSVAALAIVGPHLPLGRVSEMYAHPLVAVLVLFFVSELEKRRLTATRSLPRAARLAFALTLIAVLAVNLHKVTAMWNTAEGAAKVGRRVAKRVGGSPLKRICAVVPSNWKAPGYSVFLAAPGPASAWGLSVRSQLGYREPYPGAVHRVHRRVECPTATDLVLVFSETGELAEIEPSTVLSGAKNLEARLPRNLK